MNKSSKLLALFSAFIFATTLSGCDSNKFSRRGARVVYMTEERVPYVFIKYHGYEYVMVDGWNFTRLYTTEDVERITEEFYEEQNEKRINVTNGLYYVRKRSVEREEFDFKTVFGYNAYVTDDFKPLDTFLTPEEKEEDFFAIEELKEIQKRIRLEELDQKQKKLTDNEVVR